jgi:hypothetical protein
MSEAITCDADRLPRIDLLDAGSRLDTINGLCSNRKCRIAVRQAWLQMDIGLSLSVALLLPKEANTIAYEGRGGQPVHRR